MEILKLEYEVLRKAVKNHPANQALTKIVESISPSAVWEGVTIILSTHDPLIAKKVDRILYIRDGTLISPNVYERLSQPDF